MPQSRAGWAKTHWPSDWKWKVKILFGHRHLSRHLVKYSFHATYSCLLGQGTNLSASKYLSWLARNHITCVSPAINIWQEGRKKMRQAKKESESERDKGIMIMKGAHSVLNETSALVQLSILFVYCLNISQTFFFSYKCSVKTWGRLLCLASSSEWPTVIPKLLLELHSWPAFHRRSQMREHIQASWYICLLYKPNWPSWSQLHISERTFKFLS